MSLYRRSARLLVATPVLAVALSGQPSATFVVNGGQDALRLLWRDPGAIAAKDLYWGSGSSGEAPKPPFTFVREDLGGSKPKVHVTDAAGMAWSVKFRGDSPRDNEVHAEVAASRLLWAHGYLVEESYYVAEGVIRDVRGLTRAATMVTPDGRFRVARFEKRPPHITRTGRPWSFRDNPFLGSRELSGLKILMTLLNSWDTKRGNNTVLQVRTNAGGLEDWYVISDLGSTFGRMDHQGLISGSGVSLVPLLSRRSRWDLDDYVEQPFIDGVSGSELKLHYKGDVSMRKVPLDHASWLAGFAGELTAAQVRRAFEAAGASPPEIDGFSARVMEKISELRRAVAAGETH